MSASEMINGNETDELIAFDVAADSLESLNRLQMDYNILQDQLEYLPRKLRHSVLAPVAGTAAFMPAELKHPGELLVLLGENTFAEVSASQASGIVARRLAHLSARVDAVKSRMHISTTKESSSDIQQQESQPGTSEFVNDDEMLCWREKHRTAIRDAKKTELSTGVRNDGRPTQVSEGEYERLMKRLDELEQMEGEDDDDEVKTNKKVRFGDSPVEENTGVRKPGDDRPTPISLEEYNRLMRRLDELEQEDDDETEEEEGQSDVDEGVELDKKVRFSPSSPAEKGHVAGSSNSKLLEKQQGNVEQKIVNEVTGFSALPRSILKKTDYVAPPVPPEEPAKIIPGDTSVFSGDVSEKVGTEKLDLGAGDANTETVKPKKQSLFKQRRQK